MPIVFIRGKVVVYSTNHPKGKSMAVILPMSLQCYDNDRDAQISRFTDLVNRYFNNNCTRYFSQLAEMNQVSRFISCEPKGDLSIHLSMKDAQDFKESNFSSKFTKNDYYESVYLTLVDQLESEHEPLQSQYAELQ